MDTDHTRSQASIFGISAPEFVAHFLLVRTPPMQTRSMT